MEAVQYSGAITSVQWGIASVLWRVLSTLGDNINTVRVFSTVGVYQYSGGYLQYSGG